MAMKEPLSPKKEQHRRMRYGETCRAQPTVYRMAQMMAATRTMMARTTAVSETMPKTTRQKAHPRNLPTTMTATLMVMVMVMVIEVTVSPTRSPTMIRMTNPSSSVHADVGGAGARIPPSKWKTDPKRRAVTPEKKESRKSIGTASVESPSRISSSARRTRRRWCTRSRSGSSSTSAATPTPSVTCRVFPTTTSNPRIRCSEWARRFRARESSRSIERKSASP
mmetsp:Transcript_14790/g.34362  ORF Transcript_14790/g.34362 Transcript_14790/m.34362 type:complete len:223 (-) Transcript_14790:506-1174(-)